MTRTIDASLLTDLSAASAEKCELIELEFGSGTVWFTTAPRSVSWNSKTWLALGGLLEIEGLGDTIDDKAQGVGLKVSGVDQTILALVLNEQHRGRRGRIYYAHFNRSTGAVVGTPILMFDGFLNGGFDIKETRPVEGKGSVSIHTRLSSRLAELDMVRGIRTNTVSHQVHYSTDTFFQHVEAISNMKVWWGTKEPGQFWAKKAMAAVKAEARANAAARNRKQG